MEFVKENENSVDVMTDCGCGSIPLPYVEFPVTDENEGSVIGIPTMNFPLSTTENELKKKVIKEFCEILNKLLCGVGLNLDFLLEEISLISKNRYLQNNEIYSLEDISNPLFNELHINLDNLTEELLDALLKAYNDFVLVLQGPQGPQGETGPRGPKGQDGIVTFESLSPELRLLIKGDRGSDGLTPRIDPTTKHWIIGDEDTGIIALGVDGENGRTISAYDIAVLNGFVGSQLEWLEFLRGRDGRDGIDGRDGVNGRDGIDGHTPVITINEEGYWVIDGTPTNVKAKGEKGEPGIVENQIQSDWNEENQNSPAYILNKPTVFSGNYNDLSNKPTLFSGDYNDLDNRPTIPELILSDWNLLDSSQPDFIKNKPNITEIYAQINNILERISALEYSQENPAEPLNKKYFYVGTEKPTFINLALEIEDYPAEQTYTNNSGAKAHIFVLTNDDKAVEFINASLNAQIDQLAVDITTIPGYKIWETAVGTANNGNIIIRIN